MSSWISFPRIVSRSPIAFSKRLMRLKSSSRIRSSIVSFDRHVEDVDDLGLLAVAVEPADPLLDAHRVPRQVVVDHHVDELEVEALARDLGADEDVWPRLLAERLDDAWRARRGRSGRTGRLTRSGSPLTIRPRSRRASSSIVLRKNENTMTLPSTRCPVFDIGRSSASSEPVELRVDAVYGLPRVANVSGRRELIRAVIVGWIRRRGSDQRILLDLTTVAGPSLPQVLAGSGDRACHLALRHDRGERRGCADPRTDERGDRVVELALLRVKASP